LLDGIFDVTAGIKLSFGNMTLALAVSFALGIIISLVYIKTHLKEHYSQNFALALAIIPSIIAMMIMLIGAMWREPLAWRELFAIIRFRSEEATFKDIAYVLLQWEQVGLWRRIFGLCDTFYPGALRFLDCSWQSKFRRQKITI